jgi:WD40 repeat protein
MSYSHRIDRDLARLFQSDLERFGRTYAWSRQLKVFRDETNLSATPDLWSDIEKAIDGSRRLILLASPPSARSTWITRELWRFIDRQGIVNVCIVLTEGKTPYTDHGDISANEAALTAETQALFGAGVSPRIVDLRPFRGAPRRARRSREYVQCVADVVAFVAGRNKDEVFSEHITRQRRWTLLLTVTALLGAILAAFSIRQTFAERDASKRAQEGEKSARKSEARALRMRAITETQLRASQARLLAREESPRALLLAARAWNERPRADAGDETDAVAFGAESQTSAALAEVLEAHLGLVGHLHGHSATVESLVLDGGTLVSASNRGAVLVWDLLARRHTKTIPPPKGASLNRVAASDGLIAAVYEEGVVVHDQYGTVPFSYADASAVAVNGRRRLVALGSGTGDVSLLDLAVGTIQKLTQRGGFVTLAMSPAGDRLYVGAMEQDNRIDAWDLSTRRLTTVKLTGHSLGATHIVVSADGERVLSATEGDQVVLWSRQGQRLCSWSAETTVTSVAFDGRREDRVYSTQADGTVMAWRLHETKPQQTRYAHRGGAYAVVHVPTTDTLVTGGAGGPLRLWNAEPTDPLVSTLQDSSECARLSRFDGDAVVAVCSKGLRRWSTTRAAPADVRFPANEKLRSLELHPSMALVLMPEYDAPSHDLRIWSIGASGALRTLRNPSRTLDPVALAPDGSAFFASAPGRSGGLWRWALNDEKNTGPQEVSGTPADAIAWSSDGKRFLAALANGEIVLWTSSPWKEIGRAKVESPDSITRGALDREGQQLVVGTLGGDIELRQASALDRVQTRFSHYRESIAALAFHPNGRWFAASDAGGHVAVFDVTSGNLVLQIQAAPQARVQSLEFSQNGQALLVARGDALAVVATDPDAWARLAIDVAGAP